MYTFKCLNIILKVNSLANRFTEAHALPFKYKSTDGSSKLSYLHELYSMYKISLPAWLLQVDKNISVKKSKCKNLSTF